MEQTYENDKELKHTGSNEQMVRLGVCADTHALKLNLERGKIEKKGPSRKTNTNINRSFDQSQTLTKTVDVCVLMPGTNTKTRH